MASRVEDRCPWEDTCPFAWIVRVGGDVRTGLSGLKRRLPKGFAEHAKTAERETLLAMRALLDGLLDAMEGKPTGPERGKGRKIKVE
jgi:hypothetical protein